MMMWWIPSGKSSISSGMRSFEERMSRNPSRRWFDRWFEIRYCPIWMSRGRWMKFPSKMRWHCFAICFWSLLICGSPMRNCRSWTLSSWRIWSMRRRRMYMTRRSRRLGLLLCGSWSGSLCSVPLMSSGWITSTRWMICGRGLGWGPMPRRTPL